MTLLLLAMLAMDPPVLIQNATILTVSHGTVHGSILLRDGKIAAIGNVAAPPGATVVNGSGKYVMPGIVDCHSHIMVESINEPSVAVASMVRMSDVIDPEDVNIYRALAGGVTTANILHGSADVIGGQTFVAKLRWGRNAEGLKFDGALPGIKFALGENPKRPGNQLMGTAVYRYPATRMGVEDVLRQTLTEAKNYRPSPGKRDLRLEPLVEVLQGKRLVHAHCYRQDEILMLLRVADDFGFKIATLQHALEAYKVAKEIAANGVGVSTFSDWWGFKMEAIDAIPYNAALLTRRGVLTSLSSDDPELMRHLDKEAAKTMKYGGLTETEALSLITLNPAKQLKIDGRVGSLDVGKDADVVLYDGPPLSNFSKPVQVWIDGHSYFERAH